MPSHFDVKSLREATDNAMFMCDITLARIGPSWAEDAKSAATIGALEGWNNFDDDKTRCTQLEHATHRARYAILTFAYQHEKHTHSELVFDEGIDDNAPPRQMIDSESMRAAMDALMDIPEREADVIRAAIMYDVPYTEYAVDACISESRARQLAERGIKRLRMALSSE